MTKSYIISKISNIFKKDSLLILISLIIINLVYFLNSNLVLFFALFCMIIFLLIIALESILKNFNTIQNEHKIVLLNLHKSYIQSLNFNKNLHHITTVFPNTISEAYISWKATDCNVTWVFVDNNKNYLFFTLDSIINNLIISDNFSNNLNYPANKLSFFNLE